MEMLEELEKDFNTLANKIDFKNYDPLDPNMAEPRTFQNTLVCGMCNGDVRIFPITGAAEDLFKSQPSLPTEELRKRNPWIKLFVRNNDSPEQMKPQKPKEEEESPAEVHEEYRPGGEK